MLESGDGGGFFNAQSAHPFENPTILTNLLGLLLMPLIGAALTNTFGRMVGDERQGWALLATMLMLLLAGAVALHGASRPAAIRCSPDPGWTSTSGQPRRQGDALRRSRLSAVLRNRHGDLIYGAVNAMHGQLPASEWVHAAGQYDG